jgi:hypothetical protein
MSLDNAWQFVSGATVGSAGIAAPKPCVDNPPEGGSQELNAVGRP